MQGGNSMIHSEDGIIEISGEYSELLADMLLITKHFTMVTESMKDANEDYVKYMLKESFERFPETITDFTKLFVEDTQ